MGSPTLHRVLIAEDESSDRSSLRDMLHEHGYDVVAEASNATQAVELSAKMHPDITLLGAEPLDPAAIHAASAITASCDAPVVLLIAANDREAINRASEAGVFGLLVKPIRGADLAPAIEIALRRFAEVRSLKQQVHDLEDALETRKLVERAKGVLMDSHGLSESDAFRRMRKTSMDNRKSMKEVAEAILLSHDLRLDSSLV